MAITAPATEVQKNFGAFHDRAMREPVRVTKYGRETVYIVSAETFHALKQGQRQAVASSELTEQEAALIEAAEIPKAHRYALERSRLAFGGAPDALSGPGHLLRLSVAVSASDGRRRGAKGSALRHRDGRRRQGRRHAGLCRPHHTSAGRTPTSVKLPSWVKRRIGLYPATSWIVTAELNRFIWPGYDLRPISRDAPDVFQWGFLPTDIFEAVKQGVIAHQRARNLGIVGRE